MRKRNKENEIGKREKGKENNDELSIGDILSASNISYLTIAFHVCYFENGGYFLIFYFCKFNQLI